MKEELPTKRREYADELAFVDQDIKSFYDDKHFNFGAPILAQLAKEIRLLRETLEKVVEVNK